MTPAMRCYTMAERRAAGFPTHTPLDQYPETIFEREARRRGWVRMFWRMVKAGLVLGAVLAGWAWWVGL